MISPQFLCFIGLTILLGSTAVEASPHAKRLYQHLLVDRNIHSSVRPVVSHKDTLIVFMNLSLAQILEVNVKSQYIMLNVYVQQEWKDPQFVWNPAAYGNVTSLYVPSEMIWVPDLVLYNNAGAGSWDLGSASGSKVQISYDGSMSWKPPIIFMSQCDIDVEFFPFDMQFCKLKLGTWTHNGLLIDLRHFSQKTKDITLMKKTYDNCEYFIDYAIDLTDYVQNGEWDLLEVSAKRNIMKYLCCVEPYIDVTFWIRIKRKTLFYGVNLLTPCLALSFLTILTFYLPGSSCEKITLCISIFLACILFILVVFDLSPPTSLVIPLIVKYLLFTLISVFMSIVLSCLVLHVMHSSVEHKRISPLFRRVFLEILPKIIFLKRPEAPADECSPEFKHHFNPEEDSVWMRWQKRRKAKTSCTISEIDLALEGVRSIAHHFHDNSDSDDDSDDWEYIALVLDRVFLYLYTFVTVVTTLWIYLEAPSIRNMEESLGAEMAHTLMAQQNITSVCKERP